ncbi:peptidase dimerization domain-containing protein, partial [Candidatus Bipolaricaulota bacterium]|nr:peptidase dimerization domain-containing protein [Candidatus Bipolaricaulota bacterium]
AIEELVLLVCHLGTIEKQEHPDFGTGSISTLKIEGGYEKYSAVVPDKCRAIISRLLVPGETIETALEDVEALVDMLKLESDIDVENIPPSYNPIVQPRGEEIFKVTEENYELALGLKPEFGYINSINDGNIFVDRENIPTVAFGPRGEGYHEANEYVEIGSLVPLTKAYIGIVLDYLS